MPPPAAPDNVPVDKLHPPHPERIRLGRFELRPAQRLLLHDGQPCRLGGRAFDVLLVLIANRHRTVDRAELIEQVWPGLAVEPNNLQVQIWALRQLLGRRAIATVARRGYRYVGTGPESPARRRNVATTWPPPSPPSPHTVGGATLRTRLRWRSREA